MIDKQTFKNEVYGGITQLTRALTNPYRLEIIDLLAQGEKTVETIALELKASVANASQHLQVLKQARLVSHRKQGHHIYYALAHPDVFIVWARLRDLSIRQLPAVRQVIHDFRFQCETLEAISLQDLQNRVILQDIVLLDVRPAEEYQLGHIPNAICMPIDQWDERVSSLPVDKEIIVYCRGPVCVFADEAVARLQQQGYMARRLEGGFPDWKAQGFPVTC